MAGKNLEIKPKSDQRSNDYVLKLQMFCKDKADKILSRNQDQYKRTKVEPFTSKNRFLEFYFKKGLQNTKTFSDKNVQ